MTMQELSKEGIVLSANPNRVRGEVKDLTGNVYGELTVIEFAGRTTNLKQNKTVWTCQCSCGVTKNILAQSLTRGLTVSCGHINRKKSAERMRERSTTHGASNENWFPSYIGIIARTTKPKDKNYKYYHEKHPEITKWIEEEWIGNPWAFFKEVGEKKHAHDSIHRIDNHKGYVKGNIRWENNTIQTINRDIESGKSGYRGITIEPIGKNRRKNEGYIAHIGLYGKNIYLGSFKTIEEAKKARYDAETNYNFPHTFEV